MAKTINTANVVRWTAIGDLDSVRRLRDACAAKLRGLRIDPASVSPAPVKSDGNTHCNFNFNEMAIHGWVGSASADDDSLGQLKEIYAACLGRESPVAGVETQGRRRRRRRRGETAVTPEPAYVPATVGPLPAKPSRRSR